MQIENNQINIKYSNIGIMFSSYEPTIIPDNGLVWSEVPFQICPDETFPAANWLHHSEIETKLNWQQ